jgi:alpha/beta superfamily hydrolase
VSFVDIPVSHGGLEGLLWTVPAPRFAVVVCHPHPLYGGTMHNHVTYRLADAFRNASCAVLRFNFRGVGRSSGHHDEGRGEVDDGRAALDFLTEAVPGVPLAMAGFSFGSRVALKLAADDARVTRVMAVGLAMSLFDFGFAKVLEKPKAFIHADHDEYASLDQVRPFVDALPEPKRLFVLEDSDHLASGRLQAFEGVAAEAVRWLLSVG